MTNFERIPIGTEEIDWFTKYNLDALNLKTFVFENVSGFDKSENCVMYLAKYDKPYDIEQFNISDILIRNVYSKHVVFALYDGGFLVGYVINE